MIYIIPTDTCFGIACAVDDIKNYDKIYKIKKRKISNPLAIMVANFKWLEENTDLNKEQIDFLKEYKKPFTILTDSSPIKHWINYKDENGLGFLNNEIYEKIAFRVAHNDIQKKIIKEVGPIFLTSANLSGNKEVFDIESIEKDFSYYLEKKIVKIIGKDDLKKSNPSDIFEFIGEDTKISYFRK